MSAVRKTYRFPNAVEVYEYHKAAYGGPGKKREKREKPTREELARYNQILRERKCRWKLRNNFNVHDYFTTLTFRKEERPADMSDAKKIFAQFIRRLKAAYKKRGHVLKWIRNIEVGSKGGWHIHLVLNRIPDLDILLADLWTVGFAKTVLLYQKGEFEDLAAYLTKTPETDKRLREADHSTSRNLPVPDPEVKEFTRRRIWEREPKIPKALQRAGFYLDKGSFTEGVNPITGYLWRQYNYLRTRRD